MLRHLVFWLVTLLAAGPVAAQTELVQLGENAWQGWVPAGKEVDCIYGDYVLRNEQLVAVIARPSRLRNANMTVRGVGGMVIDLTRREAQSDQLSAFYAGAADFQYHQPQAVSVRLDGEPSDGGGALEAGRALAGAAIELAVKSLTREDGIAATTRYTLSEGEPFLLVETTYRNTSDEPRELALRDAVRADRTFQMGVALGGKLFWAYDEWFGQAYGVLFDEYTVEHTGNRGIQLTLRSGDKDEPARVDLQPGREFTLRRRLIPGAHLLEVLGTAARLSGQTVHPLTLRIQDPAGPVRGARVALQRDGENYGFGRADESGQLKFSAPAGTYEAKIEAIGRPAETVMVKLPGREQQSVEMQACGYVAARIRDAEGAPIPCKVSFQGREGTADPDFGPDSGSFAVGNLRYAARGMFRQELAPGKYDVIVSRGPEYDAVFTTVEVKAGETTRLEEQLRRTVDTSGWISADFHSHSSPSGDNTGSQLGRVLNLLAEHVEFAPCTEHNRIDTYVPHLRRLECLDLMATCSGMELTGSPLPINHQNAFPLVRKPRTQDGGAPLTDTNPVVQIERLAYWDDNSDKLVQGNHPNLVQMLSDRDQDGKFDGGFEQMFDYMDVVEVHPPEGILTPASGEPAGRVARNPIFHWMQMLNLGYRITGVVNTDAHYNFHGSGWLRNYLRSETDDPAQVKTMDMVHAAEKGHVVMTTGPFLEATLTVDESSKRYYPGDDVPAGKKPLTLHVRVQCPNWFDINRVQVVLNGRHAEKLNFRRREQPDKFGNGVVKFEQSIPLELQRDTHVIVVAAGEGLQLGPVMGEARGKTMPIAVSNPIFVDVDGGGFSPNGDQLDAPLPAGTKPKGGIRTSAG